MRALLYSCIIVCLTMALRVGAGEDDSGNTSAITLLYPAHPPAPVAYGISVLKQALAARGLVTDEVAALPAGAKGQVIVTGVAAEVNAPTNAESVFIKRASRNGQPVLVVTGADSRGAMYALLEVAAQISAAPSNARVLASITEISEQPYCRERGISSYVFNGHVRGGIFHDARYWDELFAQVAASRLNTYDLIFKGSAPIYTMFFNVDGWTSEEVGGLDVPPDEQQRNLAALQRIAKQAHDHGIKLNVGIWNHVRKPEDAERLAPYSEAAIAKFIRLVPLDGLQLRMHWESGLPRDEATLDKFWGSVFDGIKNAGRPIRIYPRAKGLPDSVIDLAVAKGMDMAVETKYWAEQFGLPFHPAHIQPGNQRDRRHGYADLLAYPKRYDMLWRLWNAGTQKLLVWGDPDYARRWVESTKIYGSGEFEIMEIPGAQPVGNGTKRALNDAHLFSDYEFQRYWCQPMMFGRLGYNPNTPPELFEREFRRRFGDHAGPVVMRALGQASKVIPRIIGSAMPDFQEQRGVPEWGSGSGLGGKATLAAYAKVNPGDVQTFLSFEEAAGLLVNGGESARVWPQQNARWFAETSDTIQKLVAQAETAVGTNRNREFDSTMTDLRILAAMAKFHSERIPAALAYQIYLKTGRSRAALDAAVAAEERALAAYRKAVVAAGDSYRTDLDLSVSDTGHWRDELALLETALADLKQLPAAGMAPMPALDFRDAVDREPPSVQHVPVVSAMPGQPVVIKASIKDSSGVKWARVLYRGQTQFQNYQMVEMTRDGDVFTAIIPAAKVNEVTEFEPETGAKWDFMYLIEIMDTKKNGRIWPDFEQSTPYVFVPLPHKTIAETGGKVAPRRPDDLIPGGSHNAPTFRIAEPTEGDEFATGSEIVVKIERTRGQQDEVIALNLDGKPVVTPPRAPREYVLSGLPNGAHKLTARLVSEGLVYWSMPVEIVIGRSRTTEQNGIK